MISEKYKFQTIYKCHKNILYASAIIAGAETITTIHGSWQLWVAHINETNFLYFTVIKIRWAGDRWEKSTTDIKDHDQNQTNPW